MSLNLRFRGLLVTLGIILIVLTIGCATVPTGSPETGYSLFGYVGKTSQSAAPGSTVLLFDATTGQPLASKEANFMGHYAFTGLQPGHYILRVEDKSREVILATENKRLDIDLSSETGNMNYAAQGMEELTDQISGAIEGGSATPPGPNDPALAEQITGVWWGFSGSTETKIGLCKGGKFSDFSESSYSGSSSDAGGNQTMNWGSANQNGGQGVWSVQGTADQGTIQVRYNNGKTRTINFRSCGDKGCLMFDGRKLCWSEGC